MTRTERNAALVVKEQTDDATLRDYSRVVWRKKWLVLGVVVVLTALALAYSLAKTPQYQASARLIYVSQLNVADPLGSSMSLDSARMQIELSSVSNEIASPELVRSARSELGAGGVSGGYSVSAAPDTTSSGQTGGNTVSITAVSPNAQTAAHVANAYAAAFTGARRQSAQEQVRQAETVVQSQLNSFKSDASRLSAEYVTLVQRLQDLRILEATVTGNFRILVPATVPSAPFSPKPVRNALVGLVAGLIFGIGLVLLIEQFDTRVRSTDEAVAIFAMPLLAQIRKMRTKELEDQPLVVLSDAHSPTAEAIRKLRGNLEFANIDGQLRSLFMTSALQHEGKTLTMCNLALSLAAAGGKVVLVDGDLRRPQVHRYLNLPNGAGVSTVLTGRTQLSHALLSYSVGPNLVRVREVDAAGAGSSGGSGLAVLTSGPIPPNAAEMIASKSFAGLIAELEERFDLVLVDAPALLAVGDTAAMAACVDGLVFLVDLTRAKRPLLIEAAMQISQMPCRKPGLVVINHPAGSRQERDHYAYYSQGESPLDTRAQVGGRKKWVPT
jgi:Mrp family chromosome partitioning ATPase/capsular polysaccharide biosynthesis protein